MVTVGGIDAASLKQYIERIERLEQEKTDVADHIRDSYAEAKASGFDTKVMRQIIKERKLTKDERMEKEHLIHLYKAALGMMLEAANDDEMGDGVVEDIVA